ncbi:MAG: polyglutamate synthase CapA [Candidatus Nomurabacteria bacterium]|nr:polyglutamate synthase CapA [Candidatus Nomurabacteria bacterium]
MKKILTTIGLTILVIAGLFFYLKSFSTETYKAPQTVVKEIEPTPNIPLLFTGDIMLGRYVETLMNNEGLDPFGTTTPFLKSHITISNLEGPIPEVHRPTPINGMTFSFPSTTPQFLKDHGVQAVSLANNHGFDKGRPGYENTKKVLLDTGISTVGAYDTTVPDYYQTFIGNTQVIVYGINMISLSWDEDKALVVTKSLQAAYPQAILVAFIHWGNEYDLTQGDEQRTFAHKLIDNGVDTIVGSHPHVVQGVEVYKNSPIFYSLGNFIFDQYFSKDTEKGLTVEINTDGNNIVYKLIPVGSDRSQAFIAEGELKQEILNTIVNSSEENIKENIKKGEVIINKK